MVRLLAIVALVSGCATANVDDSPPPYLALGDSVAFGFDPLVDLNRTEVKGYPEQLAAQRGLAITNLACPGEASGGFVSPEGADNHCRENREAYPLHADYDGTQLAAAVAYLERTPNTALVTIDIGANDVFLLDHLCDRDIACILENFVATVENYHRNLDFILSQIRRVYDGPLVGLAIYNPYPADSTAQYALERMNDAFATRLAMYDGLVADGMAAFAAHGDPCEAGLLIAMPDGTCDVHPSPAGAQVLTDAIAQALD